MGDDQIRMQFDIAASPEAVRRAMLTEEGIPSWWTRGTDASDGAGGPAPFFDA